MANRSQFAFTTHLTRQFLFKYNRESSTQIYNQGWWLALVGGTRILTHVRTSKMNIRDPQMTSAGFWTNIINFTRNFSSRNRVTMSTGQRVFIKSPWRTWLVTRVCWLKKKDCPIYCLWKLPLVVSNVFLEKRWPYPNLEYGNRSVLVSNCF